MYLQSAAQDWDGWGTTLKPGHEPIVMARKPLEGTVVPNVLKYETGALNLGECRLGGEAGFEDSRWLSNVFMDQSQANVLDGIVGDQASRFFWVGKPTGSERVCVDGVTHPTVKPRALMCELVKLVTPLGGLVLEPFADLERPSRRA